ncbi:hypothetical protein [Rhizobium leguminosarum]
MPFDGEVEVEVQRDAKERQIREGYLQPVQRPFWKRDVGEVKAEMRQSRHLYMWQDLKHVATGQLHLDAHHRIQCRGGEGRRKACRKYRRRARAEYRFVGICLPEQSGGIQLQVEVGNGVGNSGDAEKVCHHAILRRPVCLQTKAAEPIVKRVERDCSEALCFARRLVHRLFPCDKAFVGTVKRSDKNCVDGKRSFKDQRSCLATISLPKRCDTQRRGVLRGFKPCRI